MPELTAAFTKNVIRIAVACFVLAAGAGEALAVCPSFADWIRVEGTASDFVVRDFNGDGIDDLAMTKFPSHEISVVLGDASGTFDPAVSYSGDDSDTLSVAAGDFDEDGNIDLAIGTIQPHIVIRLGNGDGTFDEPVPFAVSGMFYRPVVADFDHDGDADLAVRDLPNDKTVLLLSEGDGTFTQGADYPAGSSAGDLGVGDFNDDGNPDLAVVNGGISTVSVLLGNGDGTFDGPVDYAVASSPSAIVIGDFNEDGRSDIALPSVPLNNFTILLANQDGTLAAPVTYAGKGEFADVADFDNDGNLDLIIGFYSTLGDSPQMNVQFAFGNGDGTFDAAVGYTSLIRAMAVAAGDFNGDGQSDFALSANVGNTGIHLANGTCNRAPSITAGSTVNVVAGNNGVNATIATVSDDEDAASTLTVTATFIPTGISITGITNTSGTVTATVSASNAALPGLNEVELTVQDSGGAHTTATLLVDVSVQGDANNDDQLTVLDIFYLSSYLFGGGPAPGANADANGDEQITVADVDYLVAYFFAGGPAPA